MLKRMRKNKKGFTLAELLIVVAIIGVLVAISIPIFTSQLQKARLATNQANARAAYAAVEAQYLQDDTKTGDFTYNVSSGKLADTVVKDGTTIGNNGANTDISSWTTTLNNLGSTVYKTWTLTVNKDGIITAYKGK